MDGALEKAWATYKFDFSENDRKIFEDYACHGIEEYIDKLEAACKLHKDLRIRYKIYAWFEPIFKSVRLFVPVAESGMKAAPIPGAAVLGGVVALISVAERLFEYQKRSMQMLEEIGISLDTLLKYEKDLYKDVDLVIKALELVYGDILTFCSRAVHFIADKTEMGYLRARIKGFRFMTFQNFEERLGEVVDSFNTHMRQLQARANEQDKVRLMEIRNMQEKHSTGLGQVMDVLDDQNERLRRNSELLERIDDRLEKDRQGKDNEKRLRVMQQSLEWLSNLDFSKFLAEIAEKHVEGTGDWLVTHDVYQTWKTLVNRSELLWVKGKPGCGKSFLAARAIKDLDLFMEASDANAYAFLRRENKNTNSRKDVLGSLARQIMSRQSKPVQSLDEQFRARNQSGGPDVKFVKKVLKEVISNSRITFIVIDGLDECSDEDGIGLSQDLADLVKSRNGSTVKIIVFSRPDAGFAKYFDESAQIRPDHGHNEEDLKAYFDSEFDEYGPIQLSDSERQKCLKKAQGIFQWVRLFRQRLHNPTIARRLLKDIDNMKSGLEPMYDQTLSTIDTCLRPTAWLIFIWITYGRRALTGVEMREAVADMADALYLKDLDRDPSNEDLVSICANLIFIGRDGYIRFIHESVRDHLKDSQSSTSCAWREEYQEILKNAHGTIGQICLRYLLLKDFESGPAVSMSQLARMQKRSPLLEYASLAWAWHVSRSQTNDLDELIGELMGSEPRRELCMQIHLNDAKLGFACFGGTTNSLQFLALLGLKAQATKLIANSAQSAWHMDRYGHVAIEYSTLFEHYEMTVWLLTVMLECQGRHLTEKQAIQIIRSAAFTGWADVLESLLRLNDKKFVDSIKTDVDGDMSALMNACLEGNLEAVRVLVDYGVNIDQQDAEGNTALHLAILYERWAVARLLLDKRAQTNTVNNEGWTPLHSAANAGANEIVDILLANGADPCAEARAEFNQLPLHIAAERNATEVIRTIVKHYPDNINKTCSRGYDALSFAAWANSAAAAAVLIELKCEIDHTDNFSQTALFTAAEQGALETVKVLIDKGANVKILRKDDEETAFHAAALTGRKGLLEYMVRQQSPGTWKKLLNASNKRGETIFHSAIIGGDLGAIRFALFAGADILLKGSSDFSPLHYATYYEQKSMIRTLLEKTRDPSPRSTKDDTPLHCAVRKARVDIVQELLQVCQKEKLPLDIDAINKFSNTALNLALILGHYEAAEMLLQHNAKSIRNLDGRFPIHLATGNGHQKLVRILMEHPGIWEKDFYEQTILHFAAYSGRIPVIQLVMSKCKDLLDAKNKDGDTPSMIALASGHVEAAHFLLDLHANSKIVNKEGYNLLHLAADQGNLDLVKRLTSDGGCDVRQRDKFGETALLKAAVNDNVEVFNELLRLAPETLFIADFLGNGCQHAAAAAGNLDLLKRFEILQLALDKPDSSGCTPMHYAAEHGHYLVVLYLDSIHCAVNRVDIDGDTPLMCALMFGHLETVLYLIERSTVKDLNRKNLRGRTVLTSVIACGYTELVKPLLDAGSDMYSRDGTGLNAIDYAADLPHILQILEKADGNLKFTDAATTKSVNRQTVFECCRLLSGLVESEPGTPDMFKYLNINKILSRSLFRLGDFENYTICFVGRVWTPGPDLDSRIAMTICNHCNRSLFRSSFKDVFICKSCKLESILCRECHTEYARNKNQYPKALKDLYILENEVRAVRMALPASLDFVEILEALYFFGSKLWITPTVDNYDSWEQNYNAKGEYASVKRPGQEFLSIVSSAKQNLELVFKDPAVANESVFKESNKKLLKRFEKLSRDHLPSQLQSQLRCSGHEYHVIEEQHREKLKTEGLFLDTKAGRLTSNFLQMIQNKYDDSKELISRPLALTVRESMNDSGPIPNEIPSSNMEAVSQPGFLDHATEMSVSDQLSTSSGSYSRASTPSILDRHHSLQQNLQEINKIRTNTPELEGFEALNQMRSAQGDRTVLQRLGEATDTVLDSILFPSTSPLPESEELQKEMGESIQRTPEEVLDLTLAILRQPASAWNIERLRLAFLQFYSPPKDDEMVITWAIALQIYHILDPEFCSYFVHTRLEAMEEETEE